MEDPTHVSEVRGGFRVVDVKRKGDTFRVSLINDEGAITIAVPSYALTYSILRYLRRSLRLNLATITVTTYSDGCLALQTIEPNDLTTGVLDSLQEAAAALADLAAVTAKAVQAGLINRYMRS